MCTLAGISQGDALRLQQLLVKKHLITETRLDITSLPPDSSEIHIEQVGGTVHIEGSRWYAILFIVGTLNIAVAGGSDDEEHMLGANGLLNAADKFGQFAV